MEMRIGKVRAPPPAPCKATILGKAGSRLRSSDRCINLAHRKETLSVFVLQISMRLMHTDYGIRLQTDLGRCAPVCFEKGLDL